MTLALERDAYKINGLHDCHGLPPWSQSDSNNRLSRVCFFFSSRRRHTRFDCDWSSDVCSSDLEIRHSDLISLRSEKSLDRRTLRYCRLERTNLAGSWLACTCLLRRR